MQTHWLLPPGAELAAPPADQLLLFETFRWHDLPPPAWELHGARWQRGLLALGLTGPPLPSLVPELAAHLPPGADLRVRLRLLRGGGLALDWSPLTTDDRDPAPWRLLTRPTVDAPACTFKTDPRPRLALREAVRAAGGDDVLLTAGGAWQETATANLIAQLDDGRLVTPGPLQAPLPGTTLAFLQRFVEVEATALPAHATLPRLRWMVLTNAVALLRPVAAIDGVTIAPPPSAFLALRDRLTA